MGHVGNVHVYPYYVEREAGLKARWKGWSVRFKPLPAEKTGSFAFGRRGVTFGYGERLDDWEIFVVIIPDKSQPSYSWTVDRHTL